MRVSRSAAVPILLFPFLSSFTTALSNETLDFLSEDADTNKTGTLAAPFSTFTFGAYTCSGTYTTSETLYNVVASEAIDATISTYLHGRADQGTMVPKGSQYVAYFGDVGEIKVKTDFLSDRPPFTISDAGLAIAALVGGLRQRVDLDRHPVQARILRRRLPLILVTLVVEAGEVLHSQTMGALNVVGKIYPNRRLSYSDLQQNLNEMINDIISFGSSRDVPYGWSTSTHQRGINVVLTLSRTSISAFPRFNYRSLAQLVQSVRNGYVQRGYGAVLFAGVFYGGQLIGTLTIDAPPRPLTVSLNETSNIIETARQ